jgi:hypothetical protein
MVVAGQNQIDPVTDGSIGELSAKSRFVGIREDSDTPVGGNQKGRMTIPFDLHRLLLSEGSFQHQTPSGK